MERKNRIGFIGQGWIGSNYSDDFEERNYQLVRYAKEAPYNKNLDKIKECDIVFVAVPTPTTPEGFDDSILREVLGLIGEGRTVVIKSTMLPGTTEAIQKDFSHLFIMHSPEFLSKITAASDARNPDRNIIGIPVENEEYQKKAEEVLAVLPKAPYNKICHSRAAELIKYSRNTFGFVKVVYMNLLYDLINAHGADWEVIKEAIKNDPMIANEHTSPIHKSGRGAGGCCFIKDFSAFIDDYSKNVGDKRGIEALRGFQSKNIELLLKSNKDIELLKGVHGDLSEFDTD